MVAWKLFHSWLKSCLQYDQCGILCANACEVGNHVAWAHNTALKNSNWFSEDIQKINLNLLVMKIAHICAWECFKVLCTCIQNYGNILVMVSWCLCSILYRFSCTTISVILGFIQVIFFYVSSSKTWTMTFRNIVMTTWAKLSIPLHVNFSP